ncbi:MAG: dockerin type I domain-containing protein [Planctomycetaceae bacterium]
MERRALLVAEADPFDLTRAFDVTGLAGTPTATINWGDGSQSAATVTGGTAAGTVQIRFDYSLDTTGFLSAANRRAALNAAASIVSSRLTDTLSAIRPSGTNTWTASTFHPATGAVVNFNNLNIAANEIVVYVGARELGTSQLGSGGPGGIAARGTSDWLNTVSGRGQAGALATPKTDFGPWGGSLAFDSSTNWYFGLDQAGLQSSQQDFITVAVHELTHLLGFGTAPSWTALVSGAGFVGPKAQAAYDAGAIVPLSTDRGHFLETITDSGRKTLMGPVIEAGKRDTLTPLDLAALDDIGWTVTNTRATIAAQHVYADNGSYPVTITYRGSTVGSFTDTVTATVTNTVPMLTVLGNQTATRDQALRLTNIGSLSDPGFRTETFTYSINWGDTVVDTGTATIDRAGSASAPTLASFDGSHTYTSAGTFTVTVRASDDDGGGAVGTFQVVVSQPPQLTVELNRTAIAENAGAAAATLTVRRSAPASTTATTVSLVSSDPSEATVPASITIPAGALTATVPVAAVDDALLDGTQTVTLTASGAGLTSGTASLSVTDVESLMASFTAATIAEDAAIRSFFLTVRRSNTDTSQPLTVSIAGNDSAQITVPSSAVIAAGSQEVVIPVQPINDDAAELPLPLTYRITATGYVGVDRDLVLADDEPPLFQNQLDRFDVDNSGDILPLDALRVINALSRRRQDNTLEPATDDFGDLFPDVNGDYLLTPLDALLIINELSRLSRAQSTAAGEQVASEQVASEWAAPIEPRHAAVTDAVMLQWQDGSLF